MIIMFVARIIAAINNPKRDQVKCIVPGLETISTPTKPTKIADHLLIPTFSLRKKYEKIVRINGALNKIGYISLNEWFLKEFIINAPERRPKHPLNNCMWILLVITYDVNLKAYLSFVNTIGNEYLRFVWEEYLFLLPCCIV